MITSTLGLVLLYLVAAVAGVVVCRLAKLPPMLGYLAVGVLIGPNATALAKDTARIAYLAEFGVVFLMFVIGLLFLVGFNRRLVGTITAFTLAHSITLASSVLGWLTLRSAPVEAAIALSIVLVASEALHRRETLARRLPALVAFLFGLVHGLGFAGALLVLSPQLALGTAGAGAGPLLASGAAMVAITLGTIWQKRTGAAADLRTGAAVALAHDARDAGADAGLLAPVSYTPLLDDEVAAHFEAVASVGLPVCIYNNPGTTHFTFSPALTARLSRVPGIGAVKNPAPEAAHVAADIAGLRAACAPGFRVGYAIDARATEAMLAGADAWFSVAAGLFPVPCAAIMRAVRAGDAAEARRLNAGLQPLWDLFTARTSLRVVFAAASHLGLCQAAPPLPIQPLGPDARREVAAVIGALGLS